MDQRARARQLAADYLANGNATAWFEQLYREAEEGKAEIPWADLQPNSNITEFWQIHPMSAAGKTALIIGCGLGDDAEQVAKWDSTRLPSIFQRQRFEHVSKGFRAVV